MLSLVPYTILFTRKPALARLRTTAETAEQVFAVPVVVLAKIAGSREDGLAAAAWMRAAPGAVGAAHAVVG